VQPGLKPHILDGEEGASDEWTKTDGVNVAQEVETDGQRSRSAQVRRRCERRGLLIEEDAVAEPMR